MGSENLVIGSPLFTRATVHLQNGRTLVTDAPNNSNDNRYVAGVTVNGQPWHQTFIPQRILAEGGKIEFAMSPKPTAWGSAPSAAPPSLTIDDAIAVPMADLTGDGRGTAATSIPGTNADALFDNNSRTETVFAAVPVSVTYTFNAMPRASVSFYTLTSGNTGGHPTAWVLQGSNDGKTWKQLDRRSDENFEWPRYTRPFRLAMPARYRHYRLVITAASDSRFSLAEIELLGR
jgi:hypothetical protein